MTNSIRPDVLASLRHSGEAQTRRGKPTALRGSVRKRRWEAWGGWRQNGLIGTSDVKRGDLGAGQRRPPEESESPYELRSAVTGAERRGTGRWMHEERTIGSTTGGSAF